MEITTSEMSDRQRGYRNTYRERIAGWYNGWLHIFIIYTMGFTALYIYVANMQGISAAEYLVVPATFLMCNFFEWWIHRFVMHRPSKIPLFRAVYSRHTLMHHQFFTEHEMRFADHHDWRVTFFPPYCARCLHVDVDSSSSDPGLVVMSAECQAGCSSQPPPRCI